MAHIIGVLAVVAFLLSFQMKSRRNIIAVNLLSRVLYILQYILLGALEGAVLDFTGFLASFIAKYKDREFIARRLKLVIITVNIVLLMLGIYIYENIFSLFAIAGIFFEITAMWFTKEKNIRLISLISAPFWLVYNLASSAYGSVAGNVLAIISIIIAMIRLDFKNKQRKSYIRK